MLKKYIFLSCAFFILSGTAVAGVTYDNGVITLEGVINDTDSEELVRLGFQHKPEKIIFKNSPGGTLKTALRIGRWMLGRNITAVVSGYCASACALAVLGADKREFDARVPYSSLYFHMGYSPDQQMATADEDSTVTMFNWISYRTRQEPINAIFKEAILNLTMPSGGIAFFPVGGASALRYGSNTFICKGDEARIPIDCKKNDQIDALSLGIITQQNP